MAANLRVPLTAAGVPSTDTQRAIEALQSDVQAIGRRLNQSALIYLSGNRLVMPQGGAADVYVVSDTATAGSTNTDYQVFKVLRSGQDEGKGYDARNVELPAYSLVYLGTLTVGTGDVLKLSITTTGAPSPTLTVDNLTLLCSLTASTEA